MSQPKAYSYTRFSTPEQEKGDSIRRQLKLSEEFAKAHGLVLDDTLKLTDRGISAFRGTHRTKGALGEFLKLIEQGQISQGSLLLVENLDRLSREQVLDALNQFTSIIQAGIKVITLQDGMEYSRESINANFGQLLMSIVFMSRAHDESLTKSKRMNSAWEGKRAKINERKLTRNAPAWLQLSEDKTKYHPIPERREVIRRIFQMRLEGKGPGLIARELNEAQCAWMPKNGWHKEYIVKILNTRAVIGEFQPHTVLDRRRQPAGDPIPDYFPSVVDKELFDQVQAIIKSNGNTPGNGGGRTGKVSNLFTHLVKCSICSGPMAFVGKGPPPKGGPYLRGHYLQCDRARRGLGCERETFPYEPFETMVLTYCKGLSASDLLPKSDERQSELSSLRNQLLAVDGELNQVEQQISNVVDSISSTDNKELRKTLEDRASSLLVHKATLEGQKINLEANIDRITNDSRETKEQLKNVRELIDYMDGLEGQDRINLRLRLRAQLQQLIERIRVFPTGYEQYNRRTIIIGHRHAKERMLMIENGKVQYMDGLLY